MTIYINVEPPFDFIRVDHNGKEKSRGTLGNLAAVTNIRDRGGLIGVIPGQLVNMRSAALPTSNRKKIAAALPMALEEDLVGDLDALHIVPLKPWAQKLKQALVVDKEQLDKWKSEIASIGKRWDALIPDYAFLPHHAKTDCSLIYDGKDYIVIHQGEQRRQKIRQTHFQLWVDQFPDQSVKLACNDTDFFGQFNYQTPMALVNWRCSGDWRDGISKTWRGAGRFNLLIGQYTPEHKASQHGGLKLALILCLLAGGVKLASDGYDYYGLYQQNAKLDQDIATLLLETFPDIKRVVNPEVQMQNRMTALYAGSNQDNEFLTLLSLVAANPGTRSAHIEGLQFRDGQLIFTMVFDNFAQLERFHKQLQKIDGMQIELASSGSSGNKTSGRFIAMLDSGVRP